MKILYVLHTSEMDGATISLLNLVSMLKERGVVSLLAIPKNKKGNHRFYEIVKEKAIDVFPCYMADSYIIPPSFAFREFIRWVKNLILLPYFKKRSAKDLCRLVKALHPDIIHSNSGVLHEGYVVAKKFGIPHVWHIREYQDIDFNAIILPSYNAFCKKLRESWVITITDDLRSHFGLSQLSSAVTIYNGIYHRDDTSLTIPKEKYFLYASRLTPEKGIMEVLSVFSKFRKSHPDYSLRIAGYGAESFMKAVNDLITKLECQDCIEMLGYSTEVKQLMSKATALIVPSKNEGFGRMTAEAGFNGCMVIGRDTGGTKEILDYMGGMKFTSSTDLYDRMEEVVSMSHDDYYKRVLVSQSKAVEMYSIEKNCDKVYNLYYEILKTK